LFCWYITGKNSIYKNFPCPDAFLNNDLSHAVVNLEQLLVVMFIGLGIKPMYIPSHVGKITLTFQHLPSALQQC
jgi:hypothetical protein